LYYGTTVFASNRLFTFLAFFKPFITGDIGCAYGYVSAGCNLAAIFVVFFFLPIRQIGTHSRKGLGGYRGTTPPSRIPQKKKTMATFHAYCFGPKPPKPDTEGFSHPYRWIVFKLVLVILKMGDGQRRHPERMNLAHAQLPLPGETVG
jgi:hypothetical protein